MTIARKIEILTIIVAVAFSVMLLRSWQLERELRIKAEATQSADEKIILASQDAIKSRDASTAQVTAALAAQSAALQTPQQAAKVVLSYLPTPPAAPGQTVTTQAASTAIPVVDRSELSAEVQQKLPSAPAYGILTDAQLMAQARNDLSCDATGKQLTTCDQDKADLQKQLAAKTDQANTWEAVAKGGTKTQRFLRVLKYIGCAAGGAGAGAVVYRNAPAIGATVGSAAGVTACSMF